MIDKEEKIGKKNVKVDNVSFSKESHIKMMVNMGTRLPTVRRKLPRRIFCAPLANLRGILRRTTGRSTTGRSTLVEVSSEDRNEVDTGSPDWIRRRLEVQ
jgi:hypothetical protein